MATLRFFDFLNINIKTLARIKVMQQDRISRGHPASHISRGHPAQQSVPFLIIRGLSLFSRSISAIKSASKQYSPKKNPISSSTLPRKVMSTAASTTLRRLSIRISKELKFCLILAVNIRSVNLFISPPMKFTERSLMVNSARIH